MPITNFTGLPFQSMALGYRTTEMAEDLISPLASLVPCGMARKLPMYVDTDFSLSCMELT